MARRKKTSDFVPGLILGILGVLGITAIIKPLLILVLVLVIVIAISVGSFLVWNILQEHFEKEARAQRMSPIQTTGQMKFLTPREFEFYIATLFEQQGYRAEVTKQSGDEGIDIILRSRQSKETTAVQVKRYSEKNTVGRPDLQKLMGASLDYDKKCFVTTSTFSREGREYAAQNGIGLIDGAALELLAKKTFGSNYKNRALSQAILSR